jgi:predicted transcriptional regulator
MKQNIDANHATFCPQAYKSFEGALEAFFSFECPQLGGIRTRQVLVRSISDMVRQFYPETSHMRPGQVTWPTVHREEFSSYGKSIKQTRLTTVVLDLVRSEDALERAKGKKLRVIKKEAVARMCKQAFEQDGCLTNAEMAILLKISPGSVSNYIKEWEVENREVLPRRGSIHDMGPTLTHKKIIIEKLFIEQKTVQQVSRETAHSLPAIQRYISAFKQVLLCKQKGMSTEETAFSIGRTVRLTREYELIIEGYKEKNYVMEALLRSEIGSESRFQSAINELLDKGHY